MTDRADRVAAVANLSAYDARAASQYIDGAPHIKHASLRALHATLAVRVYESAKQHSAMPKVLDLGAGEGTVTSVFLQLGARVTAVDTSSSQLDALRARCKRFGDRLEVRCEDARRALSDKSQTYDVIVASSFLHHVPDFMGVVTEATLLLTPWGQFFSLQDPLRYDSVGIPTRMLSVVAYCSWRVLQGDVVGGLRRRLRRHRGIYLEDSVHDNAEFHVIRNGVDQDAVCGFLSGQGFDCEIVRYFSTQSRVFQPVGAVLGATNTFAVVAQRRHPHITS